MRVFSLFAAHAGTPHARNVRKKVLTVLKRVAILAFLALITVLIVNRAREMDWPEVLNALKTYNAGGVAAAFALGVPAYVVHPVANNRPFSRRLFASGGVAAPRKSGAINRHRNMPATKIRSRQWSIIYDGVHSPVRAST
jgi:hypothetical protein